MPERFEVVRMLAGQLETTFASRRSACNVVTSFPVFFFFFWWKRALASQMSAFTGWGEGNLFIRPLHAL